MKRTKANRLKGLKEFSTNNEKPVEKLKTACKFVEKSGKTAG